MKSLPPGLLLALTSALILIDVRPLSAVTEATTDPVGFTTLTVNGTGGIKTSEITYLGIGLARPVEFEALAETVAGLNLYCSSATWSNGQFSVSPKPGYFLEIFSGARAGLLTAVTTCDSINQSITVADDLSSLGVESSNISFKLRKYWSLNSLFGSANEAGFTAGTSTTSDTISIYNPNASNGAGGYDQYYFSSGGRPGIGWRLIGAADATVSRGDDPISLDEGLVIRRISSAALTITLPGAVKIGQTITTVFPGPNFIANVYPSGVMTLGKNDLTSNPPKYSSNLYTGVTSSGVQPGTATTADLVLIYNPAADSGVGGYEQYYYSTNPRAGIGWRLVGATSPDDASGTVLATGRSILLKRTAATPFNWVVPQPFSTP